MFIIIGSEESLIGGLGSGHLREKHHNLAGSDLVRGGLHEEAKIQLKKLVTDMAEINSNTVNRYLIVISILWYCLCFWCSSFQLSSDSQIAFFGGEEGMPH